MPEPIPLEMPPGEADAIAALVGDIRSAGRCLASVDVRISGPAMDTAGWLGDDASAAAAQVSGVAGLVRAAYDALTRAADRLASHAEHLLEARSRIRALEHEQDQQFEEAWRRWYGLPDLQAQLMIGGPGVRAIVADVEAGEAGRRRRHAALLEEIEDDAAATARVLADASDVVGGRGRTNQANRVVAFLAAQLPGWGDRELTRSGRGLAERLTHEGKVLALGNRLARDAAPFANSPAFANAFLGSLGTDGVRWLLRFLAGNQFGSHPAMAQLLASAFGAAVPSGAANDRVADVLGAVYVSPDTADGDADTLAAGLATLLTAGLTLPSGGARVPTVAEWTRQILVREQALGAPVGRRQVAGAPELSDPTALAIGILADRADAGVSAGLLADPRVWDALLTRAWNDGGDAVGRVIGAAASQPGDGGARAVRTGLQVIGTGLEEGDPAAWTVARDTVAAISPALGSAVAAQLSVATDALSAWTDVTPGGGRKGVLQGLAYLVVDPDAADAVETALQRWAATQSGDSWAASSAVPPAVTVAAAYLATKEYGQRVTHALDADELRAQAQSRASAWNATVGQLPNLFVGRGSAVAEPAVEALALWWDFDGTWDDEPDTGPAYERDDAVREAIGRLAAADAARADAVAATAGAAFVRTQQLLGHPQAPLSPEKDYLSLAQAALKSPMERVTELPAMPEWIRHPALSLFW